jgi:hypothetical protein
MDGSVWAGCPPADLSLGATDAPGKHCKLTAKPDVAARSTTQAVLAGGDWVEHDVNDAELLHTDFVQATLVAMVSDAHGKIAAAAARSSPEHHWMGQPGSRAGRWLLGDTTTTTTTTTTTRPSLPLTSVRTHVTRGFQVELEVDVGSGARLRTRTTHDALDLSIRVTDCRIIVA